MNKTIKILLVVSTILATIMCMTACTSSMSYTYDVTTGDKIEIKLDTSHGLSMTSELPISFKKDGKEISAATFMAIGGYDEYYYTIKNAKQDVTIHEEAEKDGLTYIFYAYTDEDGSVENNYIIKINDSNTGIILGSMATKEEAQEVFDSLVISKK